MQVVNPNLVTKKKKKMKCLAKNPKMEIKCNLEEIFKLVKQSKTHKRQNKQKEEKMNKEKSLN